MKPLWTEEFSVHASEDQYVLRRQFTKFLVLTSFGMVAGNAWIWMRSLLAASEPATPAIETVVANGSDVPVGGVKLFTYPTEHDPAILVRKRDGSLAAFSQKCTHLSCAVYYSAERNRLECPCHEGYFSIDTGRVLQGPPPRPLPRINVVERNGTIVATGVDPNGDVE
ncbi:MAG TPA: Rieske (2Fe-2S) protein [Vicinamibacterales bacterium]